MKFRFGSIWVAPGDVEAASGVTINGQQVNDPIQYYRAASTIFRPRGLRSEQIAFSSTRRFNTAEEAERFALLHPIDLPQQADLYCLCGPAESVVLFADAVLDSFSRVHNGNTVVVSYSFSASAAEADAPPPTVVEPDASMIKRGTTSIASGDSSVDITFAVPFASAPVVVCTIESPSGGDVIAARVRKGTVSTTGFTADLSAPVPASGYDLAWIASA